MSKADELFLKLGYEERPPEVDVQTYVNPKLKSNIQFWTTCDKGISFYGDHIIDKEEIKTFLQAINEKCKELGWLDMTKYICDRCGKEIEGVFFRTQTIACNGEARYSQGLFKDANYDLCEECYDEFCEWLQSQKARKN